MVIVVSIVATGAGLHVAAYFIEHKSEIGPVATLLTAAIPVSVFLVSVYALFGYLVGRFDLLHLWQLIGTAAVVVFAVIASMSGLDMALCLVILMLAPTVTVVGYEIRGHRDVVSALANNGDAARTS